MTTFRIRFSSLLVLSSLLVALVAGCGGDNASKLPGTWETREGSASMEAPKALENVDTPGGLAGAMATLAHTELSLKDDKTFALSGTMTASGTWAFDPETNVLTLTGASGAPMTATLSEAGQQLSLPNPVAGSKAIVLQKKDE